MAIDLQLLTGDEANPKNKINANTTVLITALDGVFKEVTYNALTGVLTFTRINDTVKTIDLPLELLIEDGLYDVAAKELVLILANMDEIRIPVEDLISEYTADNITMTLNGTVFSLNSTYKTKIDNTPLFVKLTQAEYDALVTKDENTIYCTKEE